MDRKQLERWGAGAGVVFVIMVVVSAFLPGSPPGEHWTTEHIRSWVLDHRRALLVSSFVMSVAESA